MRGSPETLESPESLGDYPGKAQTGIPSKIFDFFRALGSSGRALWGVLGNSWRAPASSGSCGFSGISGIFGRNPPGEARIGVPSMIFGFFRARGSSGRASWGVPGELPGSVGELRKLRILRNFRNLRNLREEPSGRGPIEQKRESELD
jgi:hypothetical protein